MKRILFFNYEFPPLGGGAANATEQLFKEFAKTDDLEIELITSSLDDDYHKIDFAKNITVHRLPIGKTPGTLNYQTKKELITYTYKAYFFARKLMQDRSFDLSHSFFGIPCGAISLLLKWQYKLPYIVSLRGADVPGYSERFVAIYKLLTGFIRKIWRSAAFVVTNSEGLTGLARSSAQKQEFYEIYNGIDGEYYKPGNRSHHEREKQFRILCAARLSYRKGFQYVVDALPEIIKKHPHVHVEFAGGDGGVMYKLKGQVQALSVQDYVTFSGHYTKDSALDLYHNADLFVMPSLNEGMSNNVLEALGCGLPVLMTNTGGARELIHEGENGYIIAFESSKDIVQKIDMMMSADLEAFGAASRAIAMSLSWDNAARKYRDLYNKTL